MVAHLTRLETDRGSVLASYRPVCRCGWVGGDYWSRGLAEIAGQKHQLETSPDHRAAGEPSRRAGRRGLAAAATHAPRLLGGFDQRFDRGPRSVADRPHRGQHPAQPLRLLARVLVGQGVQAGQRAVEVGDARRVVAAAAGAEGLEVEQAGEAGVREAGRGRRRRLVRLRPTGPRARAGRRARGRSRAPSADRRPARQPPGGGRSSPKIDAASSAGPPRTVARRSSSRERNGGPNSWRTRPKPKSRSISEPCARSTR